MNASSFHHVANKDTLILKNRIWTYLLAREALCNNKTGRNFSTENYVIFSLLNKVLLEETKVFVCFKVISVMDGMVSCDFTEWG